MTIFIIGTITIFMLLVIFEVNRLASSIKNNSENKKNGLRK